MGKTTRFGDLVRSSGRPEAFTLWTEPKKDRSFSKAVRENRVLTIIEDPKSTRKEYGQIGFHQSDNATYLVFPKPLPKIKESRVVGINYQLAEDTPPTDPLRSNSPSKEERSKTTRGKPRTLKPALKSFEVLVRRTATLEIA